MPHLLTDEPVLPGLLWAIDFDAAGQAHPVPHGEEVPDPGAFGEGFLWLHFNLVDARIESLIAQGRLGPTRLAAAALGPDEHQRVVIEGEFVGGVVADLSPGAESAINGARLHFVMGPRFLISGRRRPVRSPDAARAGAVEGEAIAAPVLLLETLVRHVIAAIATGGQSLGDELDLIEDHILEDRVRDDGRRLGPIRRDAVRLHRQLLGLRAVFHRLETDGAAQRLPATAVATAARIAQRLDSLDRDMVVLAERSRLLQDELSARVAEQSHRQLHTLSILTTLFLPPTLIAGIFGMNTKNLPLTDVEEGSIIAIGLCLASALVAYVVIRLLVIRSRRESSPTP